MKVRVLHSIAQIGAAEWDALAQGAVFSHGWFRALEAALPALGEPRHIALEADGRLAAVLPCFVQRTDPYGTLLRRVLGPAAGCAGERALVAYSPLAQRTELLAAPGVDLARAVNICADAMDEICRAEGIGLSGWPFVRSAETALGRALRAAGYHGAFLAPAAHWRNPPYASFDAYMERFKRVSRKRYKDLRYELNCLARGQVELRDVPLTELPDALLVELQARHFARHNDGAPSPFGPEFFAALKRELGERARVHIATRAGELLSYSIVLCAGPRWHMFLSGDGNLDRAHDHKLYFNLNYYYPIRRGIECGAQQLDYGLSTYECKLQRGCVLEPLHVWLRGHTPLWRALVPGLAAAVDLRYRRKHAAWPLDDETHETVVAASRREWPLAS